MADRNQKVVTVANENAADVLIELINKALAYPRKGVRVGLGPWSDMPDTWDGSGPCPPGWTASAVAVCVGPTVEVPLSDTIAEELQSPAARARMNPGERTQIDNAIAGRTTKNLADYEQRGAKEKVKP